jgi:hypothetical protein
MTTPSRGSSDRGSRFISATDKVPLKRRALIAALAEKSIPVDRRRSAMTFFERFVDIAKLAALERADRRNVDRPCLERPCAILCIEPLAWLEPSAGRRRDQPSRRLR